LITLYITPVIYVYLDRLQNWKSGRGTNEMDTAPEIRERETVFSK
jgi:hypothetical protein